MRRKTGWTIGVLWLCAGLSAVLLADEAPPATTLAAAHEAHKPPASASRPSAPDMPEPVLTEHELKIGRPTLKYTAAAGFIPLKDAADKLRAKVFYIAYEKTAAQTDKTQDRPITFVFNGGPGAASVWLHLGAAGPQRVGVPDNGFVPAPPYALTENSYSWLDFTDLVFIDPVGTGFSRAEPDHAKEFYNYNGDIESVADVIRLYLTRNHRWASAKFIAGESYGTTRAAGLSEFLHDRYGIDASGIVLISTVLNFQTLEFAAGNDTPYPLWLPSYTAVAWYHKKLPPDLQQTELAKVVAEARKWAIEIYLPALLKGSSLEQADRDRLAQQLARYTGLPLDYVQKARLKVLPWRFEKALLSDQQRLLGRMDARITGYDADPLNDSPDFDPSLSGFVGIFSSCFNDYVQRELKFSSDLPYEFLSPNVGPWDFGRGGGYLNVSTTLRSAMTKMPAMKVVICSGYFDLATPFTAADYTVNQMPLGELKQNIVQHYYEGGHMLYLNRPALEKLHEDLGEFYGMAKANPPSP